MNKSIILTNEELVARHITETLKQEVLGAAEVSKPCHVFISGGNAPKKFFALLAEEYSQQIPWNALHLWWVDERCVPPDDPESNFGVNRDLLLSKVDIPDSNIHRMRGEAAPEEEALRYARELNRYLQTDDQEIPVADWIILGIGEDGHTASLFPPMLPLDDKAVTLAAEHPTTGQKRVSLGAGTICAAKKVTVLVVGEHKAHVVRQIFEKSPDSEKYPITHIIRNCPQAEWLMDEDAAGGIL